MKIPESVSAIIGRLEEAGFETLAVGGCVRDSLMGREPVDWDLCTSARPEQVKAALPGLRVLDTGLRHGTVTVLTAGGPCEVTTFRVEGPYTDSRRPDSVEFTGDLVLDLSRRDFTVNAMAFSPRRGLVDPFGGRADLDRRLLRAVGDPPLRFGEDALRILRGVRFSAALGFEVEARTAAAMLEKRELLDDISAERKRDELLKALQSGRIRGAFTRFREIVARVIPELRPCFDAEQRTAHHCYDVYTHILTAVDSYSGNDPCVRAALLLHDIAKPLCRRYRNGADHFKGHPAAGAKLTEDILRRLRLDNGFTARAVKLVRAHDIRLVHGMPQILKMCCIFGDGLMPELFDMMEADIAAQSDYKREEKLALVDRGRKNYALVMENGLCRSLSGLAVDGESAVALGLKGREIRAALRHCLNGVMNGRAENDPRALGEYMRELAVRIMN